MRPILAIFVFAALALAPICASRAANTDYGKVVSQSFDPAAQVTETHLANGLVILTKEAHAAPVVDVDIAYKVGSRDEVSGTTGLSHILEHMMFKGTQKLPAGAIDYLCRQAGAENNANTGTDYTQYFELVAANRLEAMLRMEADRMENSAFRPGDLASEMTVVRSELEGDVNDPGFELYNYGLLPVAFSAHPYRWPAIGFVSDVEAVQHNRNVIYSYYKQHYMPNNAVLVLVGDFKTADAIALCQEYFGVYPPGVLAQHHITPEPAQHGKRTVALRRPGTTGEILVAFHDPGLGTADHYTMDVISQILSGGVSARLYQDMIESGLAQNASMYDEDQKDPYLDVFDATPQSGVDLDKLEDAIHQEIVKLQTTPVSTDELQAAINQIDASFVFEKDSISAQATTLALYAAISSYKYEDTYLQHIHKVTPAMVQAVANKYFVEDNETVARFEPIALAPGQTLPPPPSGEHFGSRQTTGQQAAEFEPIARSYGLENLSTPKVTSKPTRIVLPNGLTVIVQENHANKTVAISGYVRAGSVFATDNKQVASMTAEMIQRGTDTKSYLQLAQQLDDVGAGLNISSSVQAVDIDGQCLSKDFGLTIGTLADELTHASFPQDQLDKVISEDYTGLEQARQNGGGKGDAGPLADIAFAQAIYPKGHPFWSPSLDDIEVETKSMTRQQLVDFYHAYYRPDATVLVVVGDVTPSQVRQTVASALGDWARPSTPAPQIEIPDVPLPVTAPAPQLIAIPDTAQTSILYGFPGELKRTDKDYYAAMLANYVLGDGRNLFGSRMGHTIRDVEGLTYTIYSYFDAELGAGAWEAFAGTNPHNANRTLSEMKRITTEFVASGATAEELRQAKDYLIGAFPSRLETNAGVAGLLASADQFGLGLDYPNRYFSIIQGVTLAQVNAAARKHLHPEKAVVILSGATPK
jgi:zinc protease